MSSVQAAGATGSSDDWETTFATEAAKIRPDVSHEESAKDMRALLETGLLRHTDLRDNPDKFFLAHRLLAKHSPDNGPGFWIRFTVHYNLFAGTVVALGNEEQVAALDDLHDPGRLGCFALTEKLAGVNSGLVVNTTIDWDPDSQEFVLATPDEGAHKNWYVRS